MLFHIRMPQKKNLINFYRSHLSLSLIVSESVEYCFDGWGIVTQIIRVEWDVVPISKIMKIDTNMNYLSWMFNPCISIWFSAVSHFSVGLIFCSLLHPSRNKMPLCHRLGTKPSCSDSVSSCRACSLVISSTQIPIVFVLTKIIHSWKGLQLFAVHRHERS